MARTQSASARPAGLPEGWEHELSDEELRDCAGDAVFERGLVYFAKGKVALARDGRDEAVCNAAFKVKGTKTYSVELYFEDDLLHSDCTCPHAEEGALCKHVVASGLFWRAVLQGSHAPLPVNMEAAVGKDAARKNALAQATVRRHATTATSRDTLLHFVQGQSASVLAQRLWAWAEMDRDLMADLKAWAAQSQAIDDPKAMKAAISDLLKSSGFLDWRESGVYARRAEKVLPLLERVMATAPTQARALCDYALRRLYKASEEADDSGGDIGNVFYALMDLLTRSLQAAPPPATWLDDWFDLMQADPWGLWDEKAVLDAAGPAVWERYHQRAAIDWQSWVASHSPTMAGAADAPGTEKKPARGTMLVTNAFGAERYDHERATLRTRYLNAQ